MTQTSLSEFWMNNRDNIADKDQGRLKEEDGCREEDGWQYKEVDWQWKESGCTWAEDDWKPGNGHGWQYNENGLQWKKSDPKAQSQPLLVVDDSPQPCLPLHISHCCPDGPSYGIPPTQLYIVHTQ